MADFITAKTARERCIHLGYNDNRHAARGYYTNGRELGCLCRNAHAAKERITMEALAAGITREEMTRAVAREA